MAVAWEAKGCTVCRHLWESGKHPPELVVSCVLHSRLHRCEACGTLWEQLERYADVIDEAEAKQLYPEAVPSERRQ
jgi:hypothetical protein